MGDGMELDSITIRGGSLSVWCEDRLGQALDKIGRRLTHLFLRGHFTGNTLRYIAEQSPDLCYLEMDWSHQFLVIPRHSRLKTIHLHARGPNSGARLAFRAQLKEFIDIPFIWPLLRCIQDSSIRWINISSDLKWWREAEIISLGTVDIGCVDVQGLSLQQFFQPPPDLDEDQFADPDSDGNSDSGGFGYDSNSGS